MQANDLHDLELSMLALGFARGALTGFSSSLAGNVATISSLPSATSGALYTSAPGTPTTYSSSGNLIIQAPSSSTSTALQVLVNGGASAAPSALGGAISFNAGNNTATTAGTGGGGALNFTSGNGNATAGSNSNGGAMIFYSGSGYGTGRGGDITFAAGTAASAANAGRLLLQDGQNATNAIVITSSGTGAALGFFQGAGTGGSAQKVGYGTPTGNVQTVNFPGATATLLQTAQQLAQLMLDLKAYGLIGA